MKKAVFKFLGVLLFVICAVTGLSFFDQGKAKAAEPTEKKIDVSNVRVEKNEGGKVDHALTPWETFKVSAEFSIPNPSKVKQGDTSTIGIPDQFQFGSTYADKNRTFNIVDKNNTSEVVANAAVDLKKKNLVFTYTDYPSKHAEVIGDFFFYGRVDHEKVSGEKDLDFNLTVDGKKVEGDKLKYKGAPVQPKVGIKKEGWQRESKSSDLRYKIKVNADGKHMKNVVVTDNLAFSDGTIDPSSVKVEYGTFTYTPTDGVYRLDNYPATAKPLPETDYKVTFNADNRGFTVKFLRDILPSDNIRIMYDVTLGKTPPNGTLYHNNSKLEGEVVTEGSNDNGGKVDKPNKVSLTSESWIKTLTPGGEAEGKKYSLSILKQDSVTNAPLEGAKFNVYASDKDGSKFGSSITTLTTNKKGEASVGDLVNDYYLLEEIAAPTGYSLPDKAVKLLINAKKQTEAKENGVAADAVYKITNKKIDEKVNVVGTKTWVDNNDKDLNRPEKIVVKLLADGSEVATKEITAANNWKYSFDNLPKYKDGKEIVYTISEVGVEGYTPEITGYNIKNTYNPTLTNITVEKKWDDNNNNDGIRPSSIDVQLLANGEKLGGIVTLNAANAWKHLFDNLPTKLNKKEVVYSVSEVNVPKGYTVENSGLKDGKIVLTNKHNPVEKEVSVEKKWNDENNNDGIQPTEVTVQLFAGDKAVGAPVKLNKENNWKHVFSNLKAKAEGKDIEYTVKEVDVPEGYTVTVEGKNNIVITNTHVPALTELSVIKLWEDENNKDSSRPASITVQLFANDKPQGDVVVLNEENSWKHTFANLKAKVNGEVVNYEVREIDVPSGYTVTTTVGENGEVVLTNTHKPILPPPPVVEIPPKPWTPTPPPAPQLPPKKVEVKPKQLAKTGVENDMSAMLVSTILRGAAAVLRRKKTN